MNYTQDPHSGMIIFIPTPEQVKISELELRIAQLEQALASILNSNKNST